MRFRSKVKNGYQIFAVSGVNTISFAIHADAADTSGLLGFAVERVDHTENERYLMPGFKVFESVIPVPDESIVVSTWEHPVQSLVWDDFTAKPDHDYSYYFRPIKGRARNLDRSAAPLEIRVKTEALFDKKATHQIFFNRGVASSQAYQRRFGNVKPDELSPEKEAEALEWLSRKLDDAMLQFIQSAKSGDTLLGCFYEFRFEPVALELKAAHDRGVKVQIIMDAKVNESTDKKGVFHESFPREDNLRTVKKAKLPAACVIKREARPGAIAHNKFMVLLKGAQAKPAEVWTGSANLSNGGIYGQTNAGHWVRDKATAEAFTAYWNVLKDDPGGQDGDDGATTRSKNKALREAVEAVTPPPVDWEALPEGITTVFSPHSSKEVLQMYATMVDKATDLSCITLAFGINKTFKVMLEDNRSTDHIAFFLLEKQDKPNSRSTAPFVQLGASNNVYMAWGSYLKDPIRQWTRETNNRILGFNSHVAYVHSKFMLKDPLGDDPITVCGSANFSDPSQNDNDENMLIIRGDQRVADIYFTEFNRLFNHFYFRSVVEALRSRETPAQRDASLFLKEDDTWLEKYKPGKFRQKRVAMFTRMKGFTSLPPLPAPQA
jgi:phosphatidylserine/phosphatidylglycerophosphate/cardiolipin synthase-like enzyme